MSANVPARNVGDPAINAQNILNHLSENSFSNETGSNPYFEDANKELQQSQNVGSTIAGSSFNKLIRDFYAPSLLSGKAGFGFGLNFQLLGKTLGMFSKQNITHPGFFLGKDTKKR